MKAVSLFSGGGIGEALLGSIGINVILANEISRKRADFFISLNTKTKMICGDIKEKNIKEKIIETIKKEKIKLLIVTPPCQGLSTAGKNKNQKDMTLDARNNLIFDTFSIIDKTNIDYILIENVPRFLVSKHYFQSTYMDILSIMKIKYGMKFNIDCEILNTKDYGVPQHRKRAVIKMYKKNLKWESPKKTKEITVRDAIGHLPSIEAGGSSKIKWHNSKIQNSRYIKAMKHTPEGKSALINKTHYPKKIDGTRIKGFHNTFSRIVWDKPAWTITTNNGSIGSHNTVHPGRKLKNGTYSDARVLTLLEIFLLTSLPLKIIKKIDDSFTDTLIRKVTGESVPPLFMKKILKEIRI